MRIAHVLTRSLSSLALLLAGFAPGAARAADPATPPTPSAPAAAPRPNILWISIEDTSNWLGFCGEPWSSYATTPTFDRLAHDGVYYRHAFSTAPVCSPSRFAIYTGLYATSQGTQRLRSRFPIPQSVEAFPAILRQAGYYTTNNVKTDYNTSALPRLTRQAWDESSASATWRNRKPGQPFFAVFNLTETHQSRAFEHLPAPQLQPGQAHDPDKAPVPPYFPDTPGARRTIARVQDCITAADNHAGAILADLKRDGLADDTIVFFWPDHGQGIPRGKRTLWDTGLQVPLVVYVPPKFQSLLPDKPGTTSDRLVSLLDLGPTALNLVGQPIPPSLQGTPFLGVDLPAPRTYVYGARDRVDEANDVSRSVRDQRYLYIRNYMPHLSWMQPESYSDRLDFRRELTQLAAAGKLNAAQLTYAGPTKPAEALYDTDNDPWQLTNLADDPKHADVLTRMRAALRDWQRQTRDVGMIHEWQAARMCDGNKVPLSQAAATDDQYPLDRVLDTAAFVGFPGHADQLAPRLADRDPTVRYWAAVGLRAAGPAALSASPAARAALTKAIDDESLPVRIESAGALVASGDVTPLPRLTALLTSDDTLAAEHAARTLQLLRDKAAPALPAMRDALHGTHQLSLYTRSSLQGALGETSDADGAEDAPARRPGGRRARAR